MDLSEAVWHKSSLSAQQGSCVEVAVVHAHDDAPHQVVALRDSKDRGGPVLLFQPGEWQAFTAGIRDGEFDLS